MIERTKKELDLCESVVLNMAAIHCCNVVTLPAHSVTRSVAGGQVASVWVDSLNDKSQDGT